MGKGMETGLNVLVYRSLDHCLYYPLKETQIEKIVETGIV